MQRPLAWISKHLILTALAAGSQRRYHEAHDHCTQLPILCALSSCSRLALSPEQDAQQYALDPPAQQKLTEILLNADGGKSYGLLSSDLHTQIVSSE